MAKTIFRVNVIDQSMVFVTKPTLASGGINENEIHFWFDEHWNGFNNTAVFYRTEEEVYHIPINGGIATIPAEVTIEYGDFWFGVFGSNNDVTRTTELSKVNVVKGAITIETAVPGEPTPDVYSQILKIADDARKIAQGVKDDFEAGAIPALEEQNSNKGFRFWVGTKGEYEAQKDTMLPGTFCVITDDTSMSDIISDIAQLKADVGAMKGVDLGQMPFQVDVMQFDYFVLFSNGERVGGIFDVINRNSSALTLQARWYGGFDDAISSGKYQKYADLSFYWGDGGYMVDATARIESGAIGRLTYSKIYGFKYPLQG